MRVLRRQLRGAAPQQAPAPVRGPADAVATPSRYWRSRSSAPASGPSSAFFTDSTELTQYASNTFRKS
ncbi:hypothetical protein [Corallococcus sp. 4LFB]|uniref:hypothetical protein n=1 Tax=Corallococcus sp. 4LFB TaxID=3383249 RepID=UPI003976D5E3